MKTLLILTFISIQSQAGIDLPNCKIKVTTTLKTQEVKVDEYEYHLKSKNDCDKTAAAFRDNNDKTVITQRIVEAEFNKTNPKRK